MALEKLGVQIVLTGPVQYTRADERVTKDAEKWELRDTARVAKPAYIAPHRSAMIEISCDNPGSEERVLWPSKEGIANGVFKVYKQRSVIPVENSTDSALLLHEGEEVGHWGTEKWHEKWEGMNPLRLDTNSTYESKEERIAQLVQQIQGNMSNQVADSELLEVLSQNEDAFAISDDELSRTNLVEMDINTGENAPVKMTTRPVPLSARPLLKVLLEDLQKRDIIEKSSSPWAFPIVLVKRRTAL